MTHNYNDIEFVYEAIFYKEDQYIFSNQDDFINSIKNFTTLLHRLNQDNRICQGLNIGLVYTVMINSKNFQEILGDLPCGSSERIVLDAFISSLQEIRGQSSMHTNIASRDLSKHQCFVAICHDRTYNCTSGSQFIMTSESLDKFKKDYIDDFWKKSKVIGESIAKYFRNEIKRFDWKDAKEHSKFPHLHFSDGHPYYGVALFMIDKHFPDDDLLKHEENEKDVKLHKKILKILDQKGFKTP